MTQSGKMPLGPLVQQLSKKPSRVLNWKWGYDLSLIVITAFSGLFLLSSPLWRLSVNTHCPFQRLGCWLGPLTRQGQKRPPPPSLFHHHHHHLFILCQAQAQIRDSNTLVKPAGLKAYVSLPSTCIRVLAFPVGTHCLPHWECVSLQDIRLQQDPGSDGRLYGEGKYRKQPWMHHIPRLDSLMHKPFPTDTVYKILSPLATVATTIKVMSLISVFAA